MRCEARFHDPPWLSANRSMQPASDARRTGVVRVGIRVNREWTCASCIGNKYPPSLDGPTNTACCNHLRQAEDAFGGIGKRSIARRIPRLFMPSTGCGERRTMTVTHTNSTARPPANVGHDAGTKGAVCGSSHADATVRYAWRTGWRRNARRTARAPETIRVSFQRLPCLAPRASSPNSSV